MIKTNKAHLPMQSIQGKVHHPVVRTPYRVGREGMASVLTATGGIVYNAKIGDNCMDWVADHLEPGVSLKNEKAEENGALNLFACIGNEAVVVSGEAKGAKGYVTGKHGGIDHVLAYFAQDTLTKMSIDDSILVRAMGQGLAVEGFPEVQCQNVDPELFDKLGIEEVDGYLEIPVAFVLPPEMMGSGIGSVTSHAGDYDITTGDAAAVARLGLEALRFGDIVLLQDCDNTFGREYRKDAVSVGVVVHGNSTLMGHGPGVTTIMTSKNGRIKGRIAKDANIATYLL